MEYILLNYFYLKLIPINVIITISDLSPYFTNSGNTATTTDSASVGTPVFDLSVTDDDPDHVASLTVTMTTSSTYFELNPTTRE